MVMLGIIHLSYFHILIFNVYFSVFLFIIANIRIKTVLICEIYKFKVKDAILDHVTFKRW